MSRKESEVTLEGTLGIIKPAAVVKEDQILDAIRQAGFLIVEKRRFRFSQSLAQEFYRGNKDNVAEVTSGDCVALCLARENGVNEWKELMGRSGHGTLLQLLETPKVLKTLTLQLLDKLSCSNNISLCNLDLLCTSHS